MYNGGQMYPQVCGQCGQQLGANANACAACWAARSAQSQVAPQQPPAAAYTPPPVPNPPMATPPSPPTPDSDGWNPHSGSLPPNPAFRALKIIASIIGIAGVLIAIALIAYSALR